MSTTSHPVPPFAPLRRVITGHSANGRSIVVEDAPIAPRRFGPRAFFTDLYWTDSHPAPNGVAFEDLIKGHPREFFSQDGSSMRMTEYPPGAASPFHRTVTVDYAIVLYGSITLILDNNEQVTLNAGDVLIQRGTIHSWLNEGTEWCRMLAIMLPAQKVAIKLDQEFRV